MGLLGVPDAGLRGLGGETVWLPLPQVWAGPPPGHLDCVRVDLSRISAGSMASLGHLLRPEERVRVGRFRVEADRRRALVARAALRLLLARVMLCPDPAALAIERSPKGKPWLPDGPEFNLSHGGEIVLIGLSAQAALGVDVEPFSAGAAWPEVVPRLHATERASVVAAADPEMVFLRIWTRKEAVAKATGLGLTVDTRSWAVSGGCPGVVIPPQAGDASPAWTLYDLPTVRGHIAAAAVEGPHSLRCWTLAL